MFDPEFIVLDFFAGFGGTTRGYELAELIAMLVAMVIAAVNHDWKAIKSHWENHKDVLHFNEDITKLYGTVFEGILFKAPGFQYLLRLVDIYRAFYPNAKIVLWASLECTNFSKAKGGQPRDADSRTLAHHMDRYIAAIDPDYIKIENVVEFMSWGPLTSKVVKDDDGYESCSVKFTPKYEEVLIDDEDADWYFVDGLLVNKNARKTSVQNGWSVVWQGVPESKKNGHDFIKWCKHICDMGYVNEWRELNSANFGAYTSRNRLFGIFAKEGLPIAWPEATHAKNPSKLGMHGDLKKWMPVKEVLNFEDEGESIFTREKPLVDATLERIYAGLIKFVAKGDSSFISKYFSGKPSDKNISTDGPAGTIKTKDGQALVQAAFLTKNYSGKPEGKNISVEGPAGTITTFGGSHALVQPAFLVKYNSTGADGRYNPPSIDEPAPVIATQNRLYLAQPEFLMHYYSNGGGTSSIEAPCPAIPAMDNKALVSPEFIQIHNGKSKVRSVDEPAPTVATHDRFGLVQPEYFLEKQFGNSQNQSIEDPAGTVMPNDKHRLVTAEPFIMPTNYDNGPKSIEEPSPTVTASRRHHYLINPSWFGNPGSIEKPCWVIVARQDKAPLYFVQVEEGPVSIGVYDGDSEVMIRIKQFMAAYNLVDIKMRMLRVPELLKIQGFPEDYKMVGNQSDHKKFIGNSVVPHVVKAWAEAMARRLLELRQKVA
jgi:DNA (cytosine-5)-methyltransferase 1